MSVLSPPKKAHFIALALFLAGCDQTAESEPEREEPWQKDLPVEEETHSLVHYQVQPGPLSFVLPTRKYSPSGTLMVAGGHLSLDLSRLETTEGEIQIDLSSVTMDAKSLGLRSGKIEKPMVDPDHPEQPPILPFRLESAEALNWLGLGSEVSEESKKKNRLALFSFTSSKKLSQPSARLGARRKPVKEEPAEIRKVYLTAVGELSLRSFAVHREVSVAAHFHYAEPASKNSVPDSIELELRGDVSVPLSEYDIAPRDSAGHKDAQNRALLGKRVGLRPASPAKFSSSSIRVAELLPAAAVPSTQHETRPTPPA